MIIPSFARQSAPADKLQPINPFTSATLRLATQGVKLLRACPPWRKNHYYAFGLRVSGISSRKYDGGLEGSLKNDYLYQGEFAELDEDIGWHDFELRNYDAQTGRWVQQDPFQQFASPYIGMGNDPVNTVDPSGGGSSHGAV